MLEKSNYYPGQKSKEEIVLFIRRHIIAYAKWIIIIFTMFAMPTTFIIVLLINKTIIINDANKYFFVIGIGLYYLLILAVFLTTWIDYYLDVTIITKEHLINIKQNELFNRSVAEQSLLRVQDVSSRMSGVYQSTFHFGTVYVETAGEQPNFHMTDIPNPQAVASLIMKIHEELVEEHELGKEISSGIGMDVIKPLKSQNIPKECKNNYKTNEIKKDIESEIIDLQPSDEEKVITIQDNQNKFIKNKKPVNKFKSKIKKIEIPYKNEEIKDFTIEKSWIKNEPIKNKKNDVKNNFLKNKTQKPAPKTHKTDLNLNNEGEIKEGEEIKF